MPETQLALPPPEFAEDVVPLMPEEQSLTLMIEGVLCELAPEVETTKTRGVEEQERLSSTPGKHDRRRQYCKNKTKLMTLHRKKLKIKLWSEARNKHQLRSRKACQKEIMGRKHKSFIPPPAPAQQISAFIKTFEDSTPHFNKLRDKEDPLFLRDSF